MANMYPIGRYLVALQGEQGYSETKNGNPQFFMKFTPMMVFDHSRGEFVRCEESPRTFYRVITAKSAQYAAEDFRALGFQGSKFSELDPRHPNRHIFTGEIEMTCTHEAYDGTPREKWQLVRNGGGWEEKTVDPNIVKKLDTMFGAALKASAAPAPAAQQRPSPAPAAVAASMAATPARMQRTAPQEAVAVADSMEITDDDIPF